MRLSPREHEKLALHQVTYHVHLALSQLIISTDSLAFFLKVDWRGVFV
jgi:hypothetical protein